MRCRSLAAILAVVVGVSAPAPPVFAAQPTAADLASAKKLFEQGLKLYNEGSYQEALTVFQRANDLSPRASIQRNIAQCHRDLKNFAAAYDAYQVLLTKYGATMSVTERRAIQRVIDELAMLTGTVRVTVTDPGAAVQVDGHDAGTTPLAAPLRLNLGPHTVTVTKAGFEPLSKDVKLAGGDEVRLDGPLQPEVTTGHLVVSAPADAKVEVFVDGKDVGPAPWEGDVTPGQHLVEGKGADRFAAPKPIDVPRRARVEMALDVATRSGRVQVESHTSDARISIDGNQVGTGVWEGSLPEGEHQLTIEGTGYRAYKRAFLVHAGETYVADAPPEGDSVPRYEGIYSGLALFGFATPTGASTFITTACPPESACQTSAPLGGGLAVRVGYAFGWISVEGLALGSYDYSTGSLTYPYNGSTDAARSESYAFHRFGGGGAIGVRASSLDPHLRFTGSAMGGLVAMGNLFVQNATSNADGTGANEPANNTKQQTSSTATYTAPVLVFDAGVLVGWPNAVKVHISALAIVEFVGTANGASMGPASLGNANGPSFSFSTPARQVAGGTQLFLGPMIGFDLGL
jgi:hypothetical protein